MVANRSITKFADDLFPFFIGGDPNTDSASEHFNGFIDDVVLYGSALTEGDIVAVMNGLDIGGTIEPPVLEFIPPTGGGSLAFSWTNGTFKLQFRTNLIEGAWKDYPAGNTSPVTVAPTNTGAFFRLIEQ